MIALVACLLVLVAAAPVAAEAVVTTCGQETSGQVTLDADLDCTGLVGPALRMHGGTLTMNGHTITGGTYSIVCDVSCRIIGPGAIVGSTNTISGVRAEGVSLRMSRVDVSGCLHAGLLVWDDATIDGPAVIRDNEMGIRVGGRARLRDLTITSNSHYGVDAAMNGRTGRISARRCTVTDNHIGLLADGDIKVIDSIVTGNRNVGIFAMGGFGCHQKAGATLARSTVTGNGGPECAMDNACGDVATCRRRPRVHAGSSCGTSQDVSVADTDWDICALD